jgi:hypothetical protein
MIPLLRTPKNSGTVLTRSPLEFIPQSTTTVNAERLNTADPNFHKLAVRFRPTKEDPVQLAEFSKDLHQTIFRISVAVYVPPLLYVAAGQGVALILFAVVPTLLAFLAWYTRRPNQPTFSQVAWVSAALLVYAYCVVRLDESGVLLPTPAAGASYGTGLNVFGYAALVFSVFAIQAMLDSFALYCRADPKFDPPENEGRLRRRPERALAFTAIAIVLAVACLRWVDSFAVVLLLGIAALSLSRLGYQNVGRMAFVSLAYDATQELGAPGVWRPAGTLAERRRNFIIAVALLNLTFAVGTYWSQFLPIVVLAKTAGIVPASEVLHPFRLMLQTSQGAASVDAVSRVALDPNVFSAVLSALVNGVVASLFGMAVVYGVIGAVVYPLLRLERYVDKHRSNGPDWHTYAKRVRTSEVALTGVDGETIRESDHFYLGYEPFLRFPILLHKALPYEHKYYVGDTGSGKTSLGLIPFLTQLIDRNVAWNAEAAIKKLAESPQPVDGRSAIEIVKKPHAIVILDLKGDMALFETARMYAQHEPESFRYFTPTPNHSYVFNPFNDLRASTSQSPIEIAQLVLDALSLNHGEGYGRSYYSKRSRDLLLYAIEKSKAESFDQLYEYLVDATSADSTRFREAFELVATVHALTYYPQLMTSRARPVDPRYVIHMPTVLEDRQLVYFWLPSAVESVSVREIGKLALYSLLAAAIARKNAGLPVVQTYVIIDEFQRIAGENLKVILQQARSFGISVLLANQSIADLKTAAADLRSTVRTNTRVKMYFSVQDRLEIRDLSAASGLDSVTRQTTSEGESWPGGLRRPQTVKSTSSMQSEKPRLTEDDISKISDHPRRFVLHVSRGSGLTQFGGRAIPVETSFTMTREEYERRSSATWPVELDVPDFSKAPAPKEVDAQVTQESTDRLSALFRLREKAEGLDLEERPTKAKTRKKKPETVGA